MIREWATGRRGFSAFYAGLMGAVFGADFASGKSTAEARESHTEPELLDRLQSAATVDSGLILLLEQQTEMLRVLDRRLGAVHLLKQSEQHLAQLGDLLCHSLPGPLRTALGATAAEAAALAGWQALDLGDAAKAWKHHETAKNAARESGDLAILAHVTAQQAYALLDADRAEEAAHLMKYARESAGTAIPELMRSWLWAAEAESLAALGEASASRAALDEAERLLPPSPARAELPYIVLDSTHLGRWRGHCLARLGATEAVEDLTESLAGLDSTFARAAAGLHADLALAYSVRGDHQEAREQAGKAQALANRTSSVRQKQRIARLLSSGLS
ncbi:XRE family transcriptional regulator [Catellatospora methionotrophica]|nr:XRE family transcriptional regulator [Catellatospora methionotrophica]